MRKLWLTSLFMTLFTLPTYAQHSIEWFAGISHARQKPNSGNFIVSEGGETFEFTPCDADGKEIVGAHLSRVFCKQADFHGFNVGGKYNLTRNTGIRADFSAYFNKDRAVDTFGEGAEAHTDTNVFKERTYVLVAGPELAFDNGQWRPYIHVLGGFARQTSDDTQTSTGPFNFALHDRTTSLALKAGGGIDVRVTPKLDLRVIEVDYNPIFARDRHTPGNADFDQRVKGKTAGNVTVSIGLVWR